MLVGITTDALLKKKVHAEMLETYDVRKANVINFCKKVNPKVKIDTFPLSDPVGNASQD